MTPSQVQAATDEPTGQTGVNMLVAENETFRKLYAAEKARADALLALAREMAEGIVHIEYSTGRSFCWVCGADAKHGNEIAHHDDCPVIALRKLEG